MAVQFPSTKPNFVPMNSTEAPTGKALHDQKLVQWPFHTDDEDRVTHLKPALG